MTGFPGSFWHAAVRSAALFAALTFVNVSAARQEATPRLAPQATLAGSSAGATANLPTPATVSEGLSDEELDDLLAPIALYPDVLLSAVLASSIYWDQLVAAAAFVRAGATQEQIEAQSWEDPVKAVAKIPEVIDMMVRYPEWTQTIGSAFLVQAWDVMESIQRLRAIAFDNGVLETTPQQVVTLQPETQKIIIVPANPTIVYVPRYNPSVVFIRDDRAAARAGFIGFGAGIAVGAIIWGGSCNWNGGFIAWGRGGGWGAWGWGPRWGHTRVNNNITVNNNNNTNININRPPVNRPGGGGPAFDRPGINRPDGGRPGIDRPGISRPDINRPGIERPGISRPDINRPGARDRIGQEGSRWTPDNSRINNQNTGGNRLNDWRNNPSARPGMGGAASPGRPGSIESGGIANRPPAITRPANPSGPANIGASRPSTLPATRPSNRPVTPPPTRAPTLPSTRPTTLPATRPANIGTNRTQAPSTLPATRPASPALGAGTGNRPSAFSGGASTAASNRGAASRNAGGGGIGAGRGGGGGGAGGRPSR